MMETRRKVLLGAGSLTLAASMIGSTAFGATGKSRLPAAARWAVFYGQLLPEEQFAGFEVAVLDPRYQGDLNRIRSAGCLTLGYISLGEVARDTPAQALLDDPLAKLEENPNWPGSFAVDIRRRSWKDLVLTRLAPDVLARGFDGLFLDTLDTPLGLESRDPQTWRGMTQAAVKLIAGLRREFPRAPIMLNRAYSLLPRVRRHIDAVLAESLLGTYDFGSRRYLKVDAEQTRLQIQALATVRNGSHPLPVYALDYWDPSDQAGVAALYAAERALGHAPYVATILLDALHKEPLI